MQPCIKLSVKVPKPSPREDALTRVLKESVLIRSLKEYQVGILRKSLTEIKLEQDSIIYNEGDLIADLFIITSGSVINLTSTERYFVVLVQACFKSESNNSFFFLLFELFPHLYYTRCITI